MSKHHLSISINRALLLSDGELHDMFGGSANLRESLEERKAKGELLIGSVDCKGFCPINGCPGHEVKEVINDHC